MAESPAHKFGQMVGNLLEDSLRPLLQNFCEKRSLYLDAKGKRIGVRNGNKVSWLDRYGNNHDLDFVIEKNGASDQKGRPVAFIEVAWRRYTKHSKNKAQEIQAAILPIVEEYQWDKPFLGVVLAGFFTQNSIEQLQSVGFSVLHFQYATIVHAFKNAGINIQFDESTTDYQFSECIQKINAMNEEQYTLLKEDLLNINQYSIDKFMNELARTLDRMIEKLIITPLYGTEHVFLNCADAIKFVYSFESVSKSRDIKKYEVIVKFSNGDNMDANFKDKESVEKFLRYLST